MDTNNIIKKLFTMMENFVQRIVKIENANLQEINKRIQKNKMK